jgi:hypothetical protein
MPDKETLERAREDERKGKSPTTQAGEFVREEIHHIREGKHGARSAKQAIAIGLSKARRAGVKLPLPRGVSAPTRRKAKRDSALAKQTKQRPSRRRARASKTALQREGRAAASPQALARQARSAATKRGASARSQAAKKAARTKGSRGRSAAAQKAARSRAGHERRRSG